MKTVLITGASSGIGKALALHYAKDHIVYACGRDQGRLSQLAELGDNVRTLVFDVTNANQVATVCAQVGHIDIVILNAGDCRYIDQPLAFDANAFQSVLNTNLISVGYLLEALLSKIKSGGQVVLVGSAVTLLPLPRSEAYGASKAGLAYLAETLAVDLKKHDISVSLVSPGFVKTPLTDKNDFDMPFMLTPQEAAVRIATGVKKGKFHIAFPLRLILPMKLLALLPRRLWVKMAQSIVRAEPQLK